MERFLKGKCYVKVRPEEWAAFAAACDKVGLKWPDGLKVSEHTPRGIRMELAVLAVVSSDGYLLSLPNGHAAGGRVVSFTDLKPLADKAVITSDGRVVTVRLIAGKSTVKTATATCSPDDTFRFCPGALLAMFRALDNDDDRALAMHLIAEERIKQLEPEVPEIRAMVGAPANGGMPDPLALVGDIFARALSNAFGTKVIAVHQGPTHLGKSPLLRILEDAGVVGAKGEKS